MRPTAAIAAVFIAIALCAAGDLAAAHATHYPHLKHLRTGGNSSACQNIDAVPILSYHVHILLYAVVVCYGCSHYEIACCGC